MTKELLLYPNRVTVPLMANFGAPPDPAGMLHVRLHRVEGFRTNDVLGKGNPYVMFQVRVVLVVVLGGGVCWVFVLVVFRWCVLAVVFRCCGWRSCVWLCVVVERSGLCLRV